MSSTYYFVASGGLLHLVSLKELEADDACNILKYNWLDGAWKRMDNLEGGTLFLGKPFFGVLAGEQTTLIVDSVYYFSSQTSMPKFLVYGLARIEARVSFLRNKHTMIGINSTTHTLGRVGVYWGRVETRCVWNLLCSYLDKELIDELMFDFHVSQACRDLDFM